MPTTVRAERRAVARYEHRVSSGNGRVTRRHIVLFAPDRCTKCNSSEIFSDLTEPRRVACWSCGADWFLLGAEPWR